MNITLLPAPKSAIRTAPEETGAAVDVPTPQPQPETPTPRAAFLDGEWRVVVFVLLVFAGFEGLMRYGGQWLSKDIAHLRSFPQLAAELAEMDPAAGTRVMFLGNSLTRYGVDPELFAQLCRREFDQPVQTLKMTPDNTALADWFYGFRTYFLKPNIVPDVLVLGFEGGHLRDAATHHPDRLAQYYCTLEDIPDLRRYDIHGFEAEANWGLAYLSSAYGNRDRIQRRVLDLCIPDYRSGMDTLNARMKQQRPSAQGNTQTHEPDYRRLLEFIALCEQANVQVILAAIPVPQPYDFDPSLLEVVHSTSARLVDCRHLPGLKQEMFFDGLHMDEEAQFIYTTSLAAHCAPLLSPTNLAATPLASQPGLTPTAEQQALSERQH